MTGLPPPDDLTFVRRVRRAIHRRPELGHHERCTAALIERILRRFGLTPFRPAPTSIAAVIGTADARPKIGFRADLDGLPLNETNPTRYASLNSGVMHACGHDGHAAALLVLARRLVATPPSNEAVLLLFQQAEETHPSGAPIVLRGLPSTLLPREFIGFHLWPELPEGVIGVRNGPLLASVTAVTVTVTGKTGRLHGTAFGSDSVDALAVGNQLYAALASHWPDRHPNERRPVTVRIGRMEAGQEPPNRVPIHCVLSGTLRALSWSEQDRAIKLIRDMIRNVTTDTGAHVDVTFEPGIRPPVRNDSDSAARIRVACQERGIPCRTYPDQPVGVSDDFGWYLKECRGAMFFLGCGRGTSPPDLHTPNFDFDESVLLSAVELCHSLARSHQELEAQL